MSILNFLELTIIICLLGCSLDNNNNRSDIIIGKRGSFEEIKNQKFNEITYSYQLVPGGEITIRLNLLDNYVKGTYSIETYLSDSIHLDKIEMDKISFDSIDFTAFKRTSSVGNDGAFHIINAIDADSNILESKIWCRYITLEHKKLWELLSDIMINKSKKDTFRIVSLKYRNVAAPRSLETF